jgi:hypothetical protein
MTVVNLNTWSCHLYLKIDPADNKLLLSCNSKEQVAPNADIEIMNPPIKALSTIRIIVPISRNKVNKLDISNA